MRNNTKVIIRCTDAEKATLIQAKTQLNARTWLELLEKLLHRKKIETPKVILQDSKYLLEILTELRRCGNNLNQITKVANSSKTITVSDTVKLKKLAIQISSIKSKVLRTFVIEGSK